MAFFNKQTKTTNTTKQEPNLASEDLFKNVSLAPDDNTFDAPNMVETENNINQKVDSSIGYTLSSKSPIPPLATLAKAYLKIDFELSNKVLKPKPRIEPNNLTLEDISKSFKSKPINLILDKIEGSTEHFGDTIDHIKKDTNIQDHMVNTQKMENTKENKSTFVSLKTFEDTNNVENNKPVEAKISLPEIHKEPENNNAEEEEVAFALEEQRLSSMDTKFAGDTRFSNNKPNVNQSINNLKAREVINNDEVFNERIAKIPNINDYSQGILEENHSNESDLFSGIDLKEDIHDELHDSSSAPLLFTRGTKITAKSSENTNTIDNHADNSLPKDDNVVNFTQNDIFEQADPIIKELDSKDNNYGYSEDDFDGPYLKVGQHNRKNSKKPKVSNTNDTNNVNENVDELIVEQSASPYLQVGVPVKKVNHNQTNEIDEGPKYYIGPNKTKANKHASDNPDDEILKRQMEIFGNSPEKEEVLVEDKSFELDTNNAYNAVDINNSNDQGSNNDEGLSLVNEKEHIYSSIDNNIANNAEKTLLNNDNITHQDSLNSTKAKENMPFQRVMADNSIEVYNETDISSFKEDVSISFMIKFKLFFRNIIASFFSFTSLSIIFPSISVKFGPSTPSFMFIPFLVGGLILGSIGILTFRTLPETLVFISTVVYIIYLLMFGLRSFRGIEQIIIASQKNRADIVVSIISVILPTLFTIGVIYSIAKYNESIVAGTYVFVSILISSALGATLAIELQDDPVDSIGPMSIKGCFFQLLISCIILFITINFVLALSIIATGVLVRILLGLYMSKKKISASRAAIAGMQNIVMMCILLDLLFLMNTTVEKIHPQIFAFLKTIFS